MSKTLLRKLAAVTLAGGTIIGTGSVVQAKPVQGINISVKPNSFNKPTGIFNPNWLGSTNSSDIEDTIENEENLEVEIEIDEAIEDEIEIEVEFEEINEEIDAEIEVDEVNEDEEIEVEFEDFEEDLEFVVEDSSHIEDSMTPSISDSQNEITDTRTQFENQVLELVNIERESYQLSPLTMDENVRQIARIKSTDMYEKRYFDHTSPTYGTPFQMLKSFNVSYLAAAENIAQGQRTPEAVVRAWMNSPGHRANILNASYTKLGVGLEENGYYWTQLFLLER